VFRGCGEGVNTTFRTPYARIVLTNKQLVFVRFYTVDFENEIVNSSFESAQKPTAHSGSRVNKSTFEKWTEKFPLLI